MLLMISNIALKNMENFILANTKMIPDSKKQGIEIHVETGKINFKENSRTDIKKENIYEKRLTKDARNMEEYLRKKGSNATRTKNTI